MWYTSFSKGSYGMKQDKEERILSVLLSCLSSTLAAMIIATSMIVGGNTLEKNRSKKN